MLNIASAVPGCFGYPLDFALDALEIGERMGVCLSDGAIQQLCAAFGCVPPGGRYSMAQRLPLDDCHRPML